MVEEKEACAARLRRLFHKATVPAGRTVGNRRGEKRDLWSPCWVVRARVLCYSLPARVASGVCLQVGLKHVRTQNIFLLQLCGLSTVVRDRGRPVCNCGARPKFFDLPPALARSKLWAWGSFCHRSADRVCQRVRLMLAMQIVARWSV